MKILNYTTVALVMSTLLIVMKDIDLCCAVVLIASPSNIPLCIPCNYLKQFFIFKAMRASAQAKNKSNCIHHDNLPSPKFMILKT